MSREVVPRCCPNVSSMVIKIRERRLELVRSGELTTKQDAQTSKDIKDNWPLIKQYKQVQMAIQVRDKAETRALC